jgi:hypothetical protein
MILPICFTCAISRKASTTSVMGTRGIRNDEPYADQLPATMPETVEKSRSNDAEIRQLLPKRRQTDVAILVDVALADFQETSERREYLKALEHRVAGQGIEDDVHATAIGRRHDFVGKCQGSGIHDVADSERLQEGALFRAARRGEDLRAHLLRNLHGRKADSAGCRVNQHAVAFTQLA